MGLSYTRSVKFEDSLRLYKAPLSQAREVWHLSASKLRELTLADVKRMLFVF